jgi:hypothetical protein
MMLAATIPVLNGCVPRTQVAPYRYRMTVEVDTPTGLRTGSSVIEVRPRLTGEFAADMVIDGEAVPVNLPDGRTIYALLWSCLAPDWAGWIVLWLVRTPAMDNAPIADVVRAVAATRIPLVLPRRLPAGAGYPLIGMDAWPSFVAFGDERRPKTIRFIDPDDIGGGMKLRRITLQVTDDAITHTIGDRLPWLASQRGSLKPSSMDAPLADRQLESITEVAFVRRGY